MKDLSPFLPDSAVLSTLFSHVGIECEEPAKPKARGASLGGAPPPPAAPIRFPAAAPPTVAAEPTPREAPLDEVTLRQMFAQGHSLPLQQRIEAFVRWLCRGTEAFAAFVADADGLILANQDATEAYAEAVASVLHNEEAAFRGTPLPAERTTLIEVSDSRFLQVIGVDTAAGRLVVGVVGIEPLPRAVCAQMRNALKLAVDAESRH